MKAWAVSIDSDDTDKIDLATNSTDTTSAADNIHRELGKVLASRFWLFLYQTDDHNTWDKALDADTGSCLNIFRHTG